MFLTISFVLAISGLRVLSSYTDLPNIMPLTAIAFTSSAYLNNRFHWIIPVSILTISDLFINHSYGVSLITQWSAVAICCYLLAALCGKRMGGTKSWLSLLLGTASMSLMFYFTSNTFVFISSNAYGPGLQEWARALTTGLPGYPPTYLFLRNSLIGDLTYSLLFISVTQTSQSILRLPGYRALPLY